jgi:hypothetical protein
MGKKSGSGSGMNNPDHISESLETIFWDKILKLFDADPGSGIEKFGSGIHIPDSQHCKKGPFPKTIPVKEPVTHLGWRWDRRPRGAGE